MIVVELIYNLSLLAALSAFSGFLSDRFRDNKLHGKIFQGILFGIVAVIGMMNPFVLSEGLIFDGRSIVISLSALFFGPVGGSITALFALIYRIYFGGAGLIMGSLVIFTSLAIGLYLNGIKIKKRDKELTLANLYFMGLINHAAMLSYIFILPSANVLEAYKTLTLTVIGLYPLLTMLIGKVLLDERKKIEYSVKMSDSLKLLNATFSAMSESVFVLDNRGVVKFINFAAEAMVSKDADKIEGRPLNEIIEFELSENILNPRQDVSIESFVNSETPESVEEARAKIYNKPAIPVSVSSSPLKDDVGGKIGAVLIVQDRSGEDLSRKIIKESEEKYRSLFNSIRDAILVADNEGKIATCNPAFEELFGFKLYELVGSNTSFLFKDKSGFKRLEKSYLSSFDKNLQETLQLRKRSGELFYGETGLFPIRDSAGNIVGFIGVIRDVTEKIKIERIAKENEERYKNLIENAPDAIFVLKEGIIALANKSCVDLFAAGDKAELIGRKALDFVSPEDHPSILARMERITRFKESVPPAEERIIKLDGSGITYVETIAAPFIFEGEPHIHVICRDITDRKNAEKALVESESLYRNLFQNHSAVKLLIDPADGRIIEANKAAEKFYGWALNDFQKLTVYDINEAPREELEEKMVNIIKEERATYEFSHRTAKGDVKNVEIFSSKIEIKGNNYFYSIVHDVTDKVEARNRLNMLSRVVEQSPVSVLITDPNGLIEYVNPKFTEVSGITFEEAVGKKPSSFKTGLINRAIYKEIWGTIKSGLSWTGEFESLNKSGDVIWERAVVSPITDAEGRLAHFVSINEDITELKNLIEELIDAKNKAEEMNKVKSFFFANMSHELRTPMWGIQGYTELLLELADKPELKELAQGALNSSLRLTQTLTSILALTKLEFEEVQPQLMRINPASLLEESYKDYKVAAEKKGLSILKDLRDRETELIADPVLFRGVINNLLSNAIKYSEEGSVKIACGVKRSTEGAFFIVNIEDTGIGISEEKLSVIWEPFRQASEGTTKLFQGTGLGLSIAKKYAELIGASIEVKSELGKGSVFTLRLPLLS